MTGIFSFLKSSKSDPESLKKKYDKPIKEYNDKVKKFFDAVGLKTTGSKSIGVHVNRLRDAIAFLFQGALARYALKPVTGKKGLGEDENEPHDTLSFYQKCAEKGIVSPVFFTTEDQLNGFRKLLDKGMSCSIENFISILDILGCCSVRSLRSAISAPVPALAKDAYKVLKDIKDDVNLEETKVKFFNDGVEKVRGAGMSMTFGLTRKIDEFKTVDIKDTKTNEKETIWKSKSTLEAILNKWKNNVVSTIEINLTKSSVTEETKNKIEKIQANIKAASEEKKILEYALAIKEKKKPTVSHQEINVMDALKLVWEDEQPVLSEKLKNIKNVLENLDKDLENTTKKIKDQLGGIMKLLTDEVFSFTVPSELIFEEFGGKGILSIIIDYRNLKVGQQLQENLTKIREKEKDSKQVSMIDTIIRTFFDEIGENHRKGNLIDELDDYISCQKETNSKWENKLRNFKHGKQLHVEEGISGHGGKLTALAENIVPQVLDQAEDAKNQMKPLLFKGLKRWAFYLKRGKEEKKKLVTALKSISSINKGKNITLEDIKKLKEYKAIKQINDKKMDGNLLKCVPPPPSALNTPSLLDKLGFTKITQILNLANKEKDGELFEALDLKSK